MKLAIIGSPVCKQSDIESAINNDPEFFSLFRPTSVLCYGNTSFGRQVRSYASANGLEVVSYKSLDCNILSDCDAVLAFTTLEDATTRQLVSIANWSDKPTRVVRLYKDEYDLAHERWEAFEASLKAQGIDVHSKL